MLVDASRRRALKKGRGLRAPGDFDFSHRQLGIRRETLDVINCSDTVINAFFRECFFVSVIGGWQQVAMFISPETHHSGNLLLCEKQWQWIEEIMDYTWDIESNPALSFNVQFVAFSPLCV